MPKWLPYCGEAPGPDGMLAHWNLSPSLALGLMVLGLAAYVYRAGLAMRPTLGAIAVLFFIFATPFCAMGSALFTVRIIHDVILAVVLAPLIVSALQLAKAQVPGSLFVWTAIHGLTFWLWHAPSLYAVAMSSDLVFWIMQFTITGTAAAWWTKVIRATAPAATAALLATMVAMGALGALLTFASRALYAPHWLTTQSWGMSPIEDQQIAGIIMWAPASLVYLLAALVVLYRSLDTRHFA